MKYSDGMRQATWPGITISRKTEIDVAFRLPKACVEKTALARVGVMFLDLELSMLTDTSEHGCRGEPADRSADAFSCLGSSKKKKKKVFSPAWAAMNFCFLRGERASVCLK